MPDSEDDDDPAGDAARGGAEHGHADSAQNPPNSVPDDIYIHDHPLPNLNLNGVQPTGSATLPAHRVRDGEEVAVEIYNVLLNRIAYFKAIGRLNPDVDRSRR